MVVFRLWVANSTRLNSFGKNYERLLVFCKVNLLQLSVGREIVGHTILAARLQLFGIPEPTCPDRPRAFTGRKVESNPLKDGLGIMHF